MAAPRLMDNDRFTALRDIKMCGCPSDFVHGPALPIYRVTGVEDPLRPEGIWQFAWDVAIQRMKPESIALVVTPRLHRSQNQLHVHLLRNRLVPPRSGRNLCAVLLQQVCRNRRQGRDRPTVACSVYRLGQQVNHVGIS